MAREFVRTHPDKIVYPHLGVLDGAAKIAIYLRAYVTGSTYYDTLISQTGADGTGFGSTSGFAILHSGSDGRDLLIVFRTNSSASYQDYSADPLTLNAWNTIVVQYDGTAAPGAYDRIRLYVNDSYVLPSTASGPDTVLGTTDVPLSLGIDPDGSSIPWSGRLCEVAIWEGVVLSSGERAALAAGDPADSVQPSALVFYAPLDSAYTSGVNDLVGPYTGTATGTSVVAHPSGVPTSAPGGGAAAYDLPTDAGAYAIAGADALLYEYLARPSSTVSAGSWTPIPSGTLHGVTSDQSDATYAESSTGTASDTMVLGFPAMGVPKAGPVTFTVRHQKA